MAIETTQHEAERMADQAPMREALRRYLHPLALADRIDRRRRVGRLADRIALRMAYRRGGDTLCRARARLARLEAEADARREAGRAPSRWQDLRLVAASRVFWTIRDAVEKPAGLDGYEWAALKGEPTR